MALWRDLLDYGQQVLAVKEQTRKNTADIKDIQQEVKDLTAAIQRLAYEVRIDRETEAKDREMLSLTLGKPTAPF